MADHSLGLLCELVDTAISDAERSLKRTPETVEDNRGSTKKLKVDDPPTIEKLKVHNLLTTDSDVSQTEQIPFGYPVQQTKKEEKQEQKVESTNPSEIDTFKFDKSNENHVELDNLNQSMYQIESQSYEALKVQEITHLPNGGPRGIKTQMLSIRCLNLQFLELFSCKQLTSFQDDLLLPNLKHIRLLMLNKLTNSGMLQLVKASNKLESLFCMDLPSITSLVISDSSTALKSLQIYECKQIETIQIGCNNIRDFTLSDGRNLSSFQLGDPVMGFNQLKSLKISASPKLNLDFLSTLKIAQLTTLHLISNAPSAKSYMKVEEIAFDAFVKANCHFIEELNLDKIHNISLATVLMLIDMSKQSLRSAIVDLTSVEKPKVRDALRRCDNLKDWKVEKWYIKKKWTEW